MAEALGPPSDNAHGAPMLSIQEVRSIALRLGRIMKRETSPVSSCLRIAMCGCLEDYRYNLNSLTPATKRRVVLAMVDPDYDADEAPSFAAAFGAVVCGALCCLGCGPCLPSCRECCCCWAGCRECWDGCTATDGGACGCCCGCLPPGYCCRDGPAGGGGPAKYKLSLARPLLRKDAQLVRQHETWRDAQEWPEHAAVQVLRRWQAVPDVVMVPLPPVRPAGIWNDGAWTQVPADARDVHLGLWGK